VAGGAQVEDAIARLILASGSVASLLEDPRCGIGNRVARSRGPDLITDDPELVPLAGKPQHRQQEVLP